VVVFFSKKIEAIWSRKY